MSEYSDPYPDSHEIPGVGPSGVEIPEDANRQLAKLDIEEKQARLTKALEKIAELTHRLVHASESYEQSHLEEAIMELETEAAELRDQIRNLRKENAMAEEQSPPLSPFDQMVKYWEPHVLARYYREGETVSDQKIEAYGASIGLDDEQVGEAFKVARAKVDKQKQDEAAQTEPEVLPEPSGDMMDDLMGRITERPDSGDGEK